MMKHLTSRIIKILLTGVFICAICACSMDKSAKSNFTDKENSCHSVEIAALNDIFLDFIGTEYYYEPLPIEYTPPMPPGKDATREDSLRYERDLAIATEYYKTVKRKENKNQLIISVNDTLFAFAPDSALRVQLLSCIPDTSYINLINPVNAIGARTWDVTSLTNTGRYIVKDKTSVLQEKDTQFIGSIQFSGICFDSNYTKGCLFASINGNNLPGKWVLFLLKNKDKWAIQKRYLLY
jgi:hypothetical protein